MLKPFYNMQISNLILKKSEVRGAAKSVSVIFHVNDAQEVLKTLTSFSYTNIKEMDM